MKKAFVLVFIGSRCDHILLGYSVYKKHYSYFGGHAERGESCRQTASRELYEETASLIDIHPKKLHQHPHDKCVFATCLTWPQARSILRNFADSRAKYSHMPVMTEMNRVRIFRIEDAIRLKGPQLCRYTRYFLEQLHI